MTPSINTVSLSYQQISRLFQQLDNAGVAALPQLFAQAISETLLKEQLEEQSEQQSEAAAKSEAEPAADKPLELEQLAAQLSWLSSLAFCRSAYRFKPLKFQPRCCIDGQEYALAEIEIYNQLLSYSRSCSHMDRLDTDVFNQLVKLSPEFALIKAALSADTDKFSELPVPEFSEI